MDADEPPSRTRRIGLPVPDDDAAGPTSGPRPSGAGLDGAPSDDPGGDAGRALARRLGLPGHVVLRDRLPDSAAAELWTGRDRRRGADVVVKLVPAALAARVEAEARALARLAGHPGVLPLVAVGRAADGTAWLLTDLVADGSLEQRQGSPVPLVCTWGAEVAEALAHAHRLEVVHGDVTPSNVLVDEAGRALLADFGAAVVDPGPVGHGSVAPGYTPRFAAPERRSGGPPTRATDVYGLGATLAWTLGRGAPRPLRSLLARCTAAPPQHRPTAAAVARRLRRWGRAPSRDGGPAGR